MSILLVVHLILFMLGIHHCHHLHYSESSFFFCEYNEGRIRNISILNILIKSSFVCESSLFFQLIIIIAPFKACVVPFIFSMFKHLLQICELEKIGLRRISVTVKSSDFQFFSLFLPSALSLFEKLSMKLKRFNTFSQPILCNI